MALDALYGGLQHLLEFQEKWRDVYGLVLLEHQMFDDQPSYLNKFETKNNMQFYLIAFHDHMIPFLQVHIFNIFRYEFCQD
jgi:hypothetical protein